MIDEDINKLLFFDLETVGVTRDLEQLEQLNPRLFNLWQINSQYHKRKYPEDEGLSDNEIFMKRAALTPEYGRIICATFGFINKDGSYKLTSYYGEDEMAILKSIQQLLDSIGPKGYYLCGHNVKVFDIPYIGKRLLINGLRPPTILPKHNTKPWELKVVDTKDMWNFGFNGLSSLELITCLLNIDSPKDGIHGPQVHLGYWDDGRMEDIKEYCEKDVKALMDIITKLKSY